MLEIFEMTRSVAQAFSPTDASIYVSMNVSRNARYGDLTSVNWEMTGIISCHRNRLSPIFIDRG